jgi:hypothetical protein
VWAAFEVSLWRERYITWLDAFAAWQDEHDAYGSRRLAWAGELGRHFAHRNELRAAECERQALADREWVDHDNDVRAHRNEVLEPGDWSEPDRVPEPDPEQ